MKLTSSAGRRIAVFHRYVPTQPVVLGLESSDPSYEADNRGFTAVSLTNRYSELLAAYYDATHQYGDIGDESFYLDAATDAKGPVLEVACGTGRLYLELLREGVDVDGFDVSRPMLSVLRERAAVEGLSPTVWQGDMRSIATDRTYSLILIPYNSFCNLLTVEDQLNALADCHAILESGGRLLIDAFVPRYDIVAESFGEWQPSEKFTHEGRRLTARTRASIASEPDQTFRTEHEIHDADGELIASEAFLISHLPPQQVELLARQSPFERWSVFGEFERGPLTDGDGVQVWELRRTAGPTN